MLRRSQNGRPASIRYAPVVSRPASQTSGGPQQNRFSPRRKEKRSLVWAYGVTTFNPQGASEDRRGKKPIEDRRSTILSRTLSSLKNGGFPDPILFVDNDSDPNGWADEFHLQVVCRGPQIGAFGNWILGLAELMVRRPRADYYAMFQDDFVTSKNLRPYLEQTVYPNNGYLNLYTFPRNQVLSNGRVGFFPADQTGKGAVALVFDAETALAVVSDPYVAKRPRDRQRGHKFIDGGVVTSLKSQGFREFCHNPSLVQHTGLRSTLGNPRHPQATSFKGEEFDLLTLLAPLEESPNAPETQTQAPQQQVRVAPPATERKRFLLPAYRARESPRTTGEATAGDPREAREELAGGHETDGEGG